MFNYLELCQKVLNKGFTKENRTGVKCKTIHGEMLKFNLEEGFPAVTTKRLHFKSVVAELLGFIRGYEFASQFREAGTHIWDANANENPTWLENPNRIGKDHLGRIYGVQWRNCKGVDQLKICIERLRVRDDNRRLIVNSWIPDELDYMALPPCHFAFQFHIRDKEFLDLTWYQRSCDIALGIPFNIASYALLCHIVARCTNLKPGIVTGMFGDVHIYEPHIEKMNLQIQRSTLPKPDLVMSPELKTFSDFEEFATTDHIYLLNYYHHPAIDYEFIV